MGSAWAAEETLPKDLDAFVAEGLKDWQSPGLAVAVVKDGRPVLVKGYGVREFGKPEPVDENTLFAIGSASKAFTAAALGILVDRGLTRWNARVHEIDPDLAWSDPWVAAEIRLSDLPSNHSGLSAVSEVLWYGTGLTRSEILGRLKEIPFSEGFRYHFQYRNVMFLLAGEMIPKITGGTTWDDFLTTEIFRPLGMARSLPTDVGLYGKSNVASPHILNYENQPVAVPYRAMHNIAPAGSIISSARDLVPWIKENLGQNDPPLMKPETLHFLQASQTPMWSVDAEGVVRASPRPLQSYCLGWVTESYHGTRLVWHNGNIDGMSAWVGMAPDLGLGVALLTNLDDCELRTAVFFHILDHYIGRVGDGPSLPLLENRRAALAARNEVEERWQSLSKTPLPGALPVENYTGTYSSPLLGNVTVAENGGRLLYTRTPEQSLELVVAKADSNEFLARHTNAVEDLRTGKIEITFDVVDGKVTGMTESAEGVTLSFRR